MVEVDILKAADEMVSVYGEDADLHALMRAEAAFEKGDAAGEHLWNRVTHLILELSRKKPSCGDPPN